MTLPAAHAASVDLGQALFCQWTLDPCGRVAVMSGAADEIRAIICPDHAQHETIWAMARGRTRFLLAVRRAIEGEAGVVSEVVGGHALHHVLAPVRDAAGSIVGVQGTTLFHAIQEEAHSEEAVEVYEAAGDHARQQVWSGDRFVVRSGAPAVRLVRMIPAELFSSLRDEDPSRLHLVQRIGPGRPPLRLLL
jgi:hypothetical protein